MTKKKEKSLVVKTKTADRATVRVTEEELLKLLKKQHTIKRYKNGLIIEPVKPS